MAATLAPIGESPSVIRRPHVSFGTMNEISPQFIRAHLASSSPSKCQLSHSPQYFRNIGTTVSTPVRSTPSRTVQMIKGVATPSPLSYTKFHDENGVTTPTKASLKKKRQSVSLSNPHCCTTEIFNSSHDCLADEGQHHHQNWLNNAMHAGAMPETTHVSIAPLGNAQFGTATATLSSSAAPYSIDYTTTRLSGGVPQHKFQPETAFGNFYTPIGSSSVPCTKAAVPFKAPPTLTMPPMVDRISVAPCIYPQPPFISPPSIAPTIFEPPPSHYPSPYIDQLPLHDFPAPYYMGPRRATRKTSGWQKLLCVEEMQELARKVPKTPNFDAIAEAWRRRGVVARSCRDHGSQRRNQYEFRDGPRLVSIDSSDDNWDMPPNYPDNLLPARRGPNTRSDADDFGITAYDILPWLTNLIESCCCVEKRPRRALIRSRRKIPLNAPQLETVCLDCGHVLEYRHMPPGLTKNVLGDRYDWSHLNNGPSLTDTKDTGALPRFEGYNNWSVGGGDIWNTLPSTQRKRIPLPAFQSGPSRVFNNLPNMTATRRTLGVTDPDYHNLDETGRAILPNFNEPAI